MFSVPTGELRASFWRHGWPKIMSKGIGWLKGDRCLVYVSLFSVHPAEIGKVFTSLP
jgi:hypothetical protein